MTIIVFLVDTSASMNQRTYLGTTLLDIAKGAVETFLKFRSRDQASRGMDRYMLLTFEDSPKNIKAGWRESQAVFQQELKNLQASGLTSFGAALGNALHLLNINRLQSGIDNYGQGRYPYWLEPAVVIVITDGAPLTSSSGLETELKVPVVGMLGNELTSEPFRWDQRIFSIVLRLPGHSPKVHPPPGAVIASDTGHADLMCDITGGRSYCLTSHKMLNYCLESLVQKVQSGVVMNFDKFGPDPPSIVTEDSNKNILENGLVNHIDGMINNHQAKDRIPILPISEVKRDKDETEQPWHKTKRMVLVPRFTMKGYVGHWPIPEAYWLDNQSPTLPTRSAHPTVRFKCEPSEPMVFQEFPFDKYEIEPSPLTQFILERKQPKVCWQCFIPNSNKFEGMGFPFGYLKASSELKCVNLVVMPYNYPVLLPLLEDMKSKPSNNWKIRFDKYLQSIPPYYYEPLRKALNRCGLTHVMPDRSTDIVLNYKISTHLQMVKHHAKEEFEKLCAEVARPRNAVPEGIPLAPRSQLSLSARPDLQSRLQGASAEEVNAMKQELNEFTDFRLFLKANRRKPAATAGATNKGFLTSQQTSAAMFKNPFDIPRAKLLQQLAKMRVNLQHQLSQTGIPILEGGLPSMKLKLQQAEDLHNLPVNEMGNYQNYLNRQVPPLREIEAAPVRLHAFGNPFKIDKKMLVDEADLDNMVASSSGSSNKPGLKRSNPSASESFESPAAARDRRNSAPPKRKPGPLSKSYKFVSRKRRRLDSTGSTISDWDDRSSIATIDIDDRESIISDTESVTGSMIDEIDAGRLEIDVEQVACAEPASTSAEPVAGSLEDEEQEMAETSAAEKIVPVKIKVSRDDYLKTKKQVAKIVRAPRKWTDLKKELFSLLASEKAVWVQASLLRHAIAQASRYKRLQLECELQKKLSQLRQKAGANGLA